MIVHVNPYVNYKFYNKNYFRHKSSPNTFTTVINACVRYAFTESYSNSGRNIYIYIHFQYFNLLSLFNLLKCRQWVILFR